MWSILFLILAGWLVMAIMATSALYHLLVVNPRREADDERD